MRLIKINNYIMNFDEIEYIAFHNIVYPVVNIKFKSENMGHTMFEHDEAVSFWNTVCKLAENPENPKSEVE